MGFGLWGETWLQRVREAQDYREAISLPWLAAKDLRKRAGIKRQDFTASARMALMRQREKIEGMKENARAMERSELVRTEPVDSWGLVEALFGEEVGTLHVSKDDFGLEEIQAAKFRLRELGKERVNLFQVSKSKRELIINFLGLLYGVNEGVLGMEQEDWDFLWVYAL